MNKKFISSVLAGACALSMTSIASFAADTEISDLGSDGYASQQVTVTSTTAMPTLKVTVPTTADIVLNPYKINVTTPITGNDTIMSPEYEIKNESQCGVTVAATVKATPAGAAAIATAPLKGTETTKSVFMYLETTATSDTYYGEYVAKEVKPAKGASLTPEQEAANAACKAQMAITAKDTTKDIATLSAGDTTAQSIFFKVQGDAVTAPKTPWVAADKVDLALTLKITPNANATTGAGGPVTGGFTAPEGTTAEATCSDASVTAFARVANKDNEYDMTIDSSAYGSAFLPDLKLDTGYEIVNATSSTVGTATVATTGIAANKWKISVVNLGTTDISYDIAASTDTSTVVSTITIHVTVE